MKKRNTYGIFWVLFAFIAVGLALVIYATVHTVNVSRKLSAYTHIQATVTDKVIVEGSGSDHVSTVASVVEFEVDGVTYTIKNRISSSSNSDRKGGTVEIAYNPDNPNDCLFVASEKKWFIMLLAFSVMFLTVSAVFTMIIFKDAVKDAIRHKRGKSL